MAAPEPEGIAVFLEKSQVVLTTIFSHGLKVCILDQLETNCMS